MKGVFTALITPFDSKGALDLKAFRAVIEDQIAANVIGVIPCGTTGETSTLTSDEKKRLIQTTLEVCRGTSVKVIAGTGTNNTAETVEFSKWAEGEGVHGVLVVTPYYNKPSQQGLVEHFLEVAHEVQCEVVLYNVPGRTGVSLSALSICELADHPRITTVKEATGNVSFTSEILHCVITHKRKIDVLSGDDATFLPLLSIGAVGVISVASNLFPRKMLELFQTRSAELHQKFFPLFRDLFIESNPVPIKYAMNVAGFCGPFVRKPLVEMGAENLQILRKSLEECGIRNGSRL